jgi:hypothetical protein
MKKLTQRRNGTKDAKHFLNICSSASLLLCAFALKADPDFAKA